MKNFMVGGQVARLQAPTDSDLRPTRLNLPSFFFLYPADMSATLERQVRPIYDALDSGSPKSAIVSCNKILKKSPNHVLVKVCTLSASTSSVPLTTAYKALKALALLRLQKIDECLAIVEQILPTKPVEDGIVTALMHTLRGLGRGEYTVASHLSQ